MRLVAMTPVAAGTVEKFRAFTSMPQHLTDSDSALDRAHLRLDSIERSLDDEGISVERLAALDADFQLFRREYLDDFGDFEIVALGAQILDIELRLMEINIDHRWDPLESTCRHASLSIL